MPEVIRSMFLMTTSKRVIPLIAASAYYLFFFLNDPGPTEIYPLPLPAAFPIRMHPVVPFLLLCVPAVAEIVGCYLPYLWLKDRAPLVVLLPSAASLALFVWLLSLHPVAAGRASAAYGGGLRAAPPLLLPPPGGARARTRGHAGFPLGGPGVFFVMFWAPPGVGNAGP